MSQRLSFLGGVGTVTGSKYLVEAASARLLVDCGLFQGLKNLRLKNWAPLPVDPRSIGCVVLVRFAGGHDPGPIAHLPMEQPGSVA